MRFRRLEHRFCTHIPECLEAGVLYVSMEYATAAHSCCCGCGEEVVTPFTPTDWKMTFDGEATSLWPSVGNWTLPCRSHYLIRDGRVIDARPWSNEEIAAEQRRDRAAKTCYYGTEARNDFGDEPSADALNGVDRRPWWQRFWKWPWKQFWQR